MRLYANENFPLPVVAELRGLGHDVLTAFEDGRANKGIADETVLARATALARAVLTINRLDFRHLHNTGQDHSGIIACTFDIEFAGQAGRIHKSCEDLSDLSGTLIRVNRPG